MLFGLNARKEDFVLPERGFSRFWFFFKEYFWKLLRLNLCFLLCCLPVFTIFSAVGAFAKVNYMICGERSMTPVADFWREFKLLLPSTALFGAAFNAILMGLVLGLLYLSRMGGGMFLLTAACATALFILMLISIYLPQMMAVVDLPIKVHIKNAFRVSFLHFGRSLACVALCYGALGAFLLCLPNSLIFLPLGCFGLVLFVSNYISLAGLNKCIKAD